MIQERLDSLNQELTTTTSFLKKTELRSEIANYLMAGMQDSAFAVAEGNVSLAEAEGDSLAMGVAWMGLGRLSSLGSGNGPIEGSQALLKAQSLMKAVQDQYYLGHCECMLGFCYLQLGEGELADSLQWSGLEKTKLAKNAGAGDRCLNWLCQTYTAFGEFETADSIGKELLKLATFKKEDRSRFDAFILLGRNQNAAGNPTEAIHYYLKGAEDAKSLGHQNWEGIAYQQISFCYARLEEFENAKNFALRSVSLVGEIDAMLMSLGASYVNIGQPDSAIYYLERAINMQKGHENPSRIVPAYLNLVEAYLAVGENYKALEVIDLAEKQVGDIRFDQFLFGINEKKTRVQDALGNTTQALVYANRSMEIAESSGDPGSKIEAHYLLYTLHKKKGNSSSALKHYEGYFELQQKIMEEENLRKLSRIEEEHKYNLRAAQDSILAAERLEMMETKMKIEKERGDLQAQRSLYLAIGLGIMLLFLGILFWLFSVTRKQKIEIEGQKALMDTAYSQLEKRDLEKEILLKEIHHRVKNNLQVISSLLDLQALEIEDDKAATAVEDGQNRVKAMALIHEKLYQNDNLALINVEEYILQLFDQISSVFRGEEAVTLEVDASRVSLDIDTAIPIGLILSELITNAFKYARKEKSGPKVSIGLKQNGPDDMQLTISDNGPGLPEDFDFQRARSLGLRLVRNLARQLYGSVEYRYDEGAIFSINFKSLEARRAIG